MRYTLPLAAAAIAAGIACPLAVFAQGTAYVDFGSSQQTIAGFGGASAWLVLNSAQTTTLYDSGAGHIGLSVLRARIDPGGQANWGTELSNAKLAKSHGAVVIATPWTPPASMKTNGSTVGGYLSTSQYGAYASYLQSYVNYMSSNGASLYAISMQNEPDANASGPPRRWTRGLRTTPRR
jgi:glucuronoarabinoxylan endo-1,4-beta-xylanase